MPLMIDGGVEKQVAPAWSFFRVRRLVGAWDEGKCNRVSGREEH